MNLRASGFDAVSAPQTSAISQRSHTTTLTVIFPISPNCSLVAISISRHLIAGASVPRGRGTITTASAIEEPRGVLISLIVRPEALLSGAPVTLLISLQAMACDAMDNKS